MEQTKFKCISESKQQQLGERTTAACSNGVWPLQSQLTPSSLFTRLREAPAQEKHGSNGLCPNSVSTPPPQANGRFVGAIFAENLSIFENSGFDFGNGYFDDYYGQTLFLDCILMDIMIYNGEIWCKLSALVMVYIH